MESALALATVPVVNMILEIAALLLYIPIFPTIASLIMEVIGCRGSIDVMLAYFVFGVYYGIAHDSFYGVVHSVAAFSGFVTVALLCMPGPQMGECALGVESWIRDWELVKDRRTLLTFANKGKAAIQACF